jgi:hypothetical protein
MLLQERLKVGTSLLASTYRASILSNAAPSPEAFNNIKDGSIASEREAGKCCSGNSISRATASNTPQRSVEQQRESVEAAHTELSWSRTCDVRDEFLAYFPLQSILSQSDLYSSFQWVGGPGRGPIPDLLSKKLESVIFPVGGKCAVNTPRQRERTAIGGR